MADISEYEEGTVAVKPPVKRFHVKRNILLVTGLLLIAVVILVLTVALPKYADEQFDLYRFHCEKIEYADTLEEFNQQYEKVMRIKESADNLRWFLSDNERRELDEFSQLYDKFSTYLSFTGNFEESKQAVLKGFYEKYGYIAEQDFN